MLGPSHGGSSPVSEKPVPGGEVGGVGDVPDEALVLAEQSQCQRGIVLLEHAPVADRGGEVSSHCWSRCTSTEVPSVPKQPSSRSPSPPWVRTTSCRASASVAGGVARARRGRGRCRGRRVPRSCARCRPGPSRRPRTRATRAWLSVLGPSASGFVTTTASVRVDALARAGRPVLAAPSPRRRDPRARGPRPVPRTTADSVGRADRRTRRRRVSSASAPPGRAAHPA